MINLTQHDEYNQNVKTLLEKLSCFEFGLLDTDSLNVFFEHLFFTQMSEEKTFLKTCLRGLRHTNIIGKC